MLSHDNSCMPTDRILSLQAVKQEAYLSTCLLVSHALYLSLFLLQHLPEKTRLCAKSSVSKGPLPLSVSPRLFLPPPFLPPSTSRASAHPSLPLQENALCQFVLS